MADALIHAGSVVFAVSGMVLLISKSEGLAGVRSAAVWIYAVGLIAMFGTSAIYNIWPVSSTKLILRRFDQSTIFLFIAATYTPIMSQTADDQWNHVLLVAIWAISWFGVILKLSFPVRFERLSIILCLALGWTAVFAYDTVFGALPAATIGLILGGGVLYCIGLVFHLSDNLRFQNAIWHAFVLGAAALQFSAILSL
jgi:hemolysin III